MSQEQTREDLRILAGRTELLRPQTRAEQALVGHWVGALYALVRAQGLTFRDQSGDATPVDYLAQLRRVTHCVSREKVPRDTAWLAGFYLNSALFRLAALGERIAKYAGQDRRLAKDVGVEVNRLKHDVSGVMAGRSIGLTRAVRAAWKVLRGLESVVGSQAG